MNIRFTLNGTPRTLSCEPGDNVQKILFNLGLHSVRNSDDGFGFAGSDAIIFDGVIVNASLLISELGISLVQFSKPWSMWALCSRDTMILLLH